MDFITFRCSTCTQGLKVPADKAGRRVKCTKCGTSLTVPATSQAGPVPGSKPAARPRSPYHEDEDDGPATYTVEGMEIPAGLAAAGPAKTEEDEEAEAEAERARARRRRGEDEEEDDEDEGDLEDELSPEEIAERDEELRLRLLGLDEEEEEDEEDEEYDEDEDRPRRRKKRQPKAKLDPAAWKKVRVGAVLVMVSIGFLCVALLLHEIFIIIGLTAGPKYASVLLEFHPDYQQPVNYEKKVELSRLLVAMIGGKSAFDANLILVRISEVMALLASCVMVAGCAICLAAPRRFGTKGLALATLILVGVNLIAGLVFRLLPMLGAMSFTLVPLVTRELPMIQANEERMMPLQFMWGGNPYLQVLLTVFLLVLSYGELVMFPLFLRAVGKSLKSEDLEQNALTLAKLGLSQIFVQVAYQLLAMTGTSDVLGWVLKSVYVIGMGFFLGQLTWYFIVLVRSRTVIQKALDTQEKALDTEDS